MGERGADAARAAANLCRDCIMRRVESAGAEVLEVERQHIEHVERDAADDPAMPAGPAGLAVPAPGRVPAASGLLAGHRDELDRTGDGTAPYRPGRAGCRRGETREGRQSGRKWEQKGLRGCSATRPEAASSGHSLPAARNSRLKAPAISGKLSIATSRVSPALSPDYALPAFRFGWRVFAYGLSVSQPRENRDARTGDSAHGVIVHHPGAPRAISLSANNPAVCATSLHRPDMTGVRIQPGAACRMRCP